MGLNPLSMSLIGGQANHYRRKFRFGSDKFQTLIHALDATCPTCAVHLK